MKSKDSNEKQLGGKWRRRAGCALVGVLAAITVGFLPLPSICVVAGYRDRTEHVEGQAFITTYAGSRTDIAALTVLLDAENNYCDEECEKFEVLLANCGTKKSQELEARMKKIRDEMPFWSWGNLEKGSEEYESMDEWLKTKLALIFLTSQLDEEEETARGPVLLISENE